jgi:RHS repeat-associated protein
MDRLTAMLYPGGSREQYSYDAVGNPHTYTTRSGQTRTSVFDSRNRETRTDWSGNTPDITRSFDAAGRILSENNGAVSLSYSYDAANQLLSETTQLTGQTSRTVGYAYDAGGRLSSITYPGGNVVTQTYTPRGQISGISLDGGTVASYEYNPVGATTAKTYENGLSALYRYDAAQRLIGLEHRRGLDLLAKIDYTLDSVGNRTAKTQSLLNPLTENYAYDAVDQLIQAKYGTSRTVGYQYDAVGNRQGVTENGTTAPYTANADNGFTSVGGIATETDLNGNMVSVPGGTYSYDAQNRLVSATVNGLTTEFTYDSRNRVVRRVSPNGTLNLTYSGWNLIEERDASGTLEQTYVHGAGTDELLVKITASGPAYYHHDGLGSTIALTGENGELLESYRYDAFGAATILSPSTLDPRPSTAFSNRFLFTGREWLGQAGIYDYRNRVYSAQIGRFLQTDPIRFEAGDVNLYRYVGNGPVNWVDPEGLWQLTGSAGAGIGMTITIGYNAGQLNFGSYVGFGFGASLRWQPEDSGCQHMEGAFPETRLSASLPLWGAMAIPLSSTYNNGAYVVDGVLMGYKSLISNEEQIFKRCARF